MLAPASISVIRSDRKTDPRHLARDVSDEPGAMDLRQPQLKITGVLPDRTIHKQSNRYKQLVGITLKKQPIKAIHRGATGTTQTSKQINYFAKENPRES